MSVICPTITAFSEDDYKKQMDSIVHVAHRVHIDLTDGSFAPTQTVAPKQAWWPVGFAADFHLMFKQPLPAIQELLEHKPNLIIVHAEAEGNYKDVADLCHQQGVKIGVALLAGTTAEHIVPALDHTDHVLIFSGNLGHQGGSIADLSLLDKVKMLKSLKPQLEIGWDGGVNDQNVVELINGGVEVLDVGGYIQHAQDPARAFNALQRIADETGTT